MPKTNFDGFFPDKSIQNFRFHGIKHVFINIFVQDDPHVDYTMHFCGLLGLKIAFLKCFILPLYIKKKLYTPQ